jgi:hypothetical protein
MRCTRAEKCNRFGDDCDGDMRTEDLISPYCFEPITIDEVARLTRLNQSLVEAMCALLRGMDNGR